MATIAELLIKIGADGSGASRTFDQVTNSAQKTESNVSKVGKAIAGSAFAGAIAAAVTDATRSITRLNSEMANVASLGLASDRVAELKTGVQDLSVEVGKSTSDLSDGLYNVVSAFGDSADSMSILRINAQAATAGLASTTDAINLTSAVTKAYGDTSAEAVQHAADLAFTAVRLGQTTFPELASAVGKVTPLMASLGATQEELFSILATGTGVTGTASEVVTQLRGVLQSAMAPTADMAGLLEQLGFQSGAAAVQGLGVVGFMQEVVAAADAAGVPLQKYISSIEGQTLALALAGELSEDYASKSAEVAKASGALGDAFKAQTEGINEAGFTYQQFTQRIEVLKQRMGDALLPVLGALLRIAEPIISSIERMATMFSQLPQPVQNVVVAVTLLLGVIGPLVPMFGLIAGIAGPAIAGIGVAFAALASPIGIALAALTGFVAGLITLSGMDIGATISAAMPTVNFDMESQVGSLEWGNFVGTVDLSSKVIDLQWGDFVATFDWGTKVGSFSFGDVIGSFDWQNQIAKLNWGDYIAQLTWGENVVAKINWGDFVGSLDWNAQIAKLEWGNFVSVLDWDAGVFTINWGDFVYTLDWTDMISELTWGQFVYQHDWAAYVTTIGWGDYITTIDWGSYIQTLSDWGQYIATFSWSEFIDSLTWEGVVATAIDWAVFITLLPWNMFVKVVDIATFIGTFAWTEFISKLDWAMFFSGEGISWEQFISQLDWSAFVQGVQDWAPFIGTVAWESFIENVNWPAFINMIDWSQFVPSVTWTSWISNLEWGTFVPDLNWGGWLSKIDWATVVPDFSWSQFIPSINWSIPSFPGWSAFIPGNQIGTPSFAGGLTWVGEQGPELVALPAGSRIYSNDISESMAGGMNGKTEVNVVANQVSSEIDIISLAQRVADILEWRRA